VIGQGGGIKTEERQNTRMHRRELKSTVAIRVRNVSKSFPGVQALLGINFELLTGEVHGLVGANGAGKSTFIRVLSGASQPDTGEIEVQGSPLLFEDPRLKRSAGIAAIYQELTIIPEMSVLSNAFLGMVPSRFFFTDKRRMERRFVELSNWMGIHISPHVNAGTLSVANQQMIEILRAVQTDQNVLIMDEPTAPLGPYERAKLYDLIGRLKESGVSIIFISHDLDEVLKLSDRVSVMREGLLVESRRAANWTKDALVQAMLGDVRARWSWRSPSSPAFRRPDAAGCDCPRADPFPAPSSCRRADWKSRHHHRKRYPRIAPTPDPRTTHRHHHRDSQHRSRCPRGYAGPAARR